MFFKNYWLLVGKRGMSAFLLLLPEKSVKKKCEVFLTPDILSFQHAKIVFVRYGVGIC